ncbi:MAG TPA: hypothetical protein VIK91_25395 [Nannocystis sp.]
MSRYLSAFLLVLACSDPPKPLGEAILGEWERLCATDEESTANCPGKDAVVLIKRFEPGGRVVLRSDKGSDMVGTWTLTGDELEEKFSGAGLTLTSKHRARIADGRLVLWDLEGRFGAVYGRLGATFEPAPSQESTAGQTRHTIAGVAYTIALPSGYRLSRDDNDRQEWSPASGEGFVVRLSSAPRAKREVDGQWVTPPCDPIAYGGVLTNSQDVGGVPRDVSIGRTLCLEGSDRALSCSAEHTRGYLEQSEMDAALALCDSLAVVR